MRHERERTGLPGGIPQDQFGETRLQPEAGQAGRTFDRLPEPVRPDRWYEMNALDERGSEAWEPSAVVEEIAANGEEDGSASVDVARERRAVSSIASSDRP